MEHLLCDIHHALNILDVSANHTLAASTWKDRNGNIISDRQKSSSNGRSLKANESIMNAQNEEQTSDTIPK